MKPILSRIDYHVNKTLSDLRTTELFDIIVSYPDTLPALTDLKVRPGEDSFARELSYVLTSSRSQECIAKVDSRIDVVNALQASWGSVACF
jgi:hypothetical protein